MLYLARSLPLFMEPPMQHRKQENKIGLSNPVLDDLSNANACSRQEPSGNNDKQYEGKSLKHPKRFSSNSAIIT
jgi:hypothetical protein